MNKSESDIVKGIYDLLAKNITYDHEGVSAERGSESYWYAHSMLGVLLKRTAVCDGISKAFKYLLNVVGINCLVVYGSSKSSIDNTDIENHAWNIVKINNQNYHFDLTWGAIATIDGFVNYDYYGLTDDEIQIDHLITSIVPSCKSEEENYFVKNHLIMKSEGELIRYVEEQVKCKNSFLYMKLAYDTECSYAIQVAQHKLMDLIANRGSALTIKSQKFDERKIIKLTIMNVKNN